MLLGISNAKTIKGENLGYLTGILYLAPSTTVQGINTCPNASDGCKSSCLYSAGRGKFNNVQEARINKTIKFKESPINFIKELINDIKKLQRRAAKNKQKLCIRLNGTSDIAWEHYKINGVNLFNLFPEVQFYDYTKSIDRVLKNKLNNYHLTFSRSESNDREVNELLQLGFNVAVVFDQLPQKFNSVEVIDGDNHDLRFLDKRGVVVGLKPKGQAKKDLSNFVIKIKE